MEKLAMAEKTGQTVKIDPNAEYVYVGGCTGLKQLPDLPNAKTVDISVCTGLTKLPDLPNAQIVYMSGCTGLKQLPDLPNAKIVYMSGCIGLTKLPDLPNAKILDIRGCTGLKQLPDGSTLEQYMAPGGGMERFLTGGGKSLDEIVAAGAWDCHNWDNCPTHVAYGASSIDDLPPDRQREGVLFIALFDAGFLPQPTLADMSRK